MSEVAATGPAEIAAAIDAVLAPGFLYQLDRLRWRARAARGVREGENPVRLSAQISGSEIERHRAYSPGDDLRRIDWNAYGRLDELLVRLYRAEREVPHYLVVDTSASMAFPADDRKLPFASALVVSLAYAAVRNHDPVRIICAGADLPGGHLVSPRAAHLQQLMVLREFLLACRPSGLTAVASGLQGWLQSRPPVGAAVIVSDFLCETEHCESVLATLSAKGFDVTCVRVIGPGERDPSRSFRAGRVIDAETGAAREIRLDRSNLDRYRTALRQHLGDLAQLCARYRSGCVIADTAEGVVPTLLRQIGAC